MRRAVILGSILSSLLVLGGAMPADPAPLLAGTLDPLAGSSTTSTVVDTAVSERATGSRWWQRHIDRLIGSRSMSVAVRQDGRTLYGHAETFRRVPASNEKLLASMAILDVLPPDHRIETNVAAESEIVGPLVDGNLWILGHGDPAVSGGGRYGKSLSFEPTRISRLARQIAAAGVTRITGSIVGSTGYFSHDWFAPGWKSSFPADEVALPSALTFEGNTRHSRHISDPEYWAARSLTQRLEALGVRVAGRPTSGAAPSGLVDVASVSSQPLAKLLTVMNRNSVNFFAEVLGKLLGAKTSGPPGTIAKGASGIEAFARSFNVSLVANDSSGLSYNDRVSAQGIARLLDHAADEDWGPALRKTLAGAGQGTLEDRLAGVRVRAKTGTLDRVSALSGWVWLRKLDTWAEFSILSRGLDKSAAVDIENEIVRTITRSAS
jgi:D-alanyl-D-alanine carboxypeptidase/D-alanyl-D-alanine-endopeptidase (penicillin-binding protein 4)